MFRLAAVLGLGEGGDYMIIPLMTTELSGMQALGRLLGVILTAGGIAEALSRWLMGWFRDATGTYFTSSTLLIGFALLGRLAVFGLPDRQDA